jgi:hypothetical protein
MLDAPDRRYVRYRPRWGESAKPSDGRYNLDIRESRKVAGAFEHERSIQRLHPIGKNQRKDEHPQPAGRRRRVNLGCPPVIVVPRGHIRLRLRPDPGNLLAPKRQQLSGPEKHVLGSGFFLLSAETDVLSSELAASCKMQMR